MHPNNETVGGSIGDTPKVHAPHTRRIGWLLFCFLWLTFSYAHQNHFDSATPVSRLDLLLAVFNDGRFDIDNYHENTGDKAFFNGHYYSDKAAGTTALVAPVSGSALVLLRFLNVPPVSHSGLLALSWISCALVIAPLTAAGGVALYHWLVRFVRAKTALVTVLAIYIGGAPFPYSTMLFSHAISQWNCPKGQSLRKSERSEG